MFETLFTRPGVLRRHLGGSLAVERASYLSDLAAQGIARGTILRRSACCLRVAVELERWPADRCFTVELCGVKSASGQESPTVRRTWPHKQARHITHLMWSTT